MENKASYPAWNCVICGRDLTDGQMVWLNDAPAHYPACPKEVVSEETIKQ